MNSLAARLSAATLLLTVPIAAELRTHPATQPKPSPAAALPIRRVALYKNGVGFFEHIGTVRGDSTVTIDFTTAQLNDVLQSLTAVDLGGGRVTGAAYNSTTPLEQQLKSLQLALSADPTTADFFAAIRGARVEVTGAGTPITGRILNIELRNATVDKKDDTAPAMQKPFLTVVSDAGTVRSVELGSNTNVRMLDADLHTNVNRYLETLAGNHQDGLRHLSLADHGSAAARELRVSYISEVPVWKSTYRILFDNGGTAESGGKTATVQGWAVVDNTVGSDWENVQLSLIAGAPQSFLQPLSQPYYNRRPQIGLPQEAQLTPQTHESGDAAVPASPQMQGVAGAGMASAMDATGPIMGGLGLASSPVPAANPTLNLQSKNFSMHGAEFGRATNGRMVNGAPPAPISYEDSASASITPQAKTAAFDDFFEYKLTDPVTIRKNESALVPILQTKVGVDPVTLWSPNQPTPLRALWITNTSQLTLDRGSFSILENGNFTGQGLLDPIHPGERRLLSYAADQAVRVSEDGTGSRHGQARRIEQITIAKGILTEKAGELIEHEYSIHNAAPETRTVLIEQQRRLGWELNGDSKPEETTPALYRFRVVVSTTATERLHVGERHTLYTKYALLSSSEDQLIALLRQDGDPPSVLAALQPVFEAKRRVADLQMQLSVKAGEINTITSDQNRLRQNLSALKSSAEERALIKRYTSELNAQEDRIATLKMESEALEARRAAAGVDLASRLDALTLDQPLG